MPRAEKTKSADRRYGAGSHTAAARRTIRTTRLLNRIEAARQDRDRRAAAIGMPNVQDDAVPRLRAAHSVLETTVMMALLDRQAPSEGELALAAGLGPREIQRIRDALPRSPHRG